MDWRVRALTAALMTFVMVRDRDLRCDMARGGTSIAHFLRQWAKAFVVAWPIAAATAFFVMPSARRLAERLLGCQDLKYDRATMPNFNQRLRIASIINQAWEGSALHTKK